MLMLLIMVMTIMMMMMMMMMTKLKTINGRPIQGLKLPMGPPTVPAAGGRLRVGYLSADLQVTS